MRCKFNIRYLSLLLLLSFTLFQPGLFAQQKVKIALWGDSRENAENACSNIAHILLYKITDWDFQVHCGDLTHDGTDASWQRSLHYPGVDSIFVKGKFFMCTSNHEFKDSSGKENFDKYTAGILPTNSADGSTHFYSVHISNVDVIFCDGYATSKNVMQHWLDSLLTTIPNTDWIIGVWHNPTYGDLSYKESYAATCMGWVKSLYKHHCKFIFNGHAHIYLRTKPLRPDGTLDEKDGIVHVINGTGGASFKDPSPDSPKTAFTPSEKSFPCITFITIEGNNAELKTVDARPGHNLQVIDRYETEK
ncbi:MAG: metallophosphoesterase [Candidatus Kryptoniota bacterium]